MLLLIEVVNEGDLYGPSGVGILVNILTPVLG